MVTMALGLYLEIYDMVGVSRRKEIVVRVHQAGDRQTDVITQC